jgi:hypothetical protein
MFFIPATRCFIQFCKCTQHHARMLSINILHSLAICSLYSIILQRRESVKLGPENHGLLWWTNMPDSLCLIFSKLPIWKDFQREKNSVGTDLILRLLISKPKVYNIQLYNYLVFKFGSMDSYIGLSFTFLEPSSRLALCYIRLTKATPSWLLWPRHHIRQAIQKLFAICTCFDTRFNWLTWIRQQKISIKDEE